MTEKIVKLKKLWQEKEGNLNTENAESEYKGFIEKFPLEKINDLKLDKYTNIKSQTAEEYFTHWIERKTESCGKFRTSSSFSYGVYKVNSENINDNEKRKSETDLYCTLEQKYIKAINEKYVAKEKAENYFDENVKPKLMKLIKFEEIENTNPLDINYARKIAYMYYPEKLLAIFNKTTIEAIADFFGIKEAIDLSSYKVTEKILDKVKEQFEINGDITFKITQKLTMFLWDYFGKSFPFDSKNVIFYGAPGTGKTYTVQNTIRQKVLLDDDDINDVALFTQFHPSFSYEDFIDGLKPVINNGATELKLTNGIFKKFCKKATQNLYKSRIDGKEPKLYYFVADEINRAELSTVFGELLSCLEESKRIDFDDEGNLLERSLLLDTQYSYLIKSDDDAVYTLNNKYKFGVPANLYFIGTMNDIDRSIDSFDLALRRRFSWERMDCDYDVILQSLYDNHRATNKDNNFDDYIEICKSLNNFISKNLELGKSYEIGHSYFMEIKIHNGKISTSAINSLFEHKLKPLIGEYLRGTYSQIDIEKHLKEANKIFSLPKSS